MCIAVPLPMPELAPTTDTDISVQSKETPCRIQRRGGNYQTTGDAPQLTALVLHTDSGMGRELVFIERKA